MNYVIKLSHKSSTEQRVQEHKTMEMALATALLLIVHGDYVIHSVTTEPEEDSSN